MAKQLFIHVWIDKKTGKEFMHEQYVITDLKESKSQHEQEKYDFLIYSHTLLISYCNELGASLVSEIDINDLDDETVDRLVTRGA